jgi:hypothetical protein
LDAGIAAERDCDCEGVIKTTKPKRATERRREVCTVEGSKVESDREGYTQERKGEKDGRGREQKKERR